MSEQEEKGPGTSDGEESAVRNRNHRVLAVVNPVSGTYRYERTVRELTTAAKRLGVDLDVVLTREDLDGTAAVRSKRGPYDVYLAVGGDGTVMEVAAAAMEDDIPLAVLPRGTANAVAWHFTLPIDARTAVRVAVRGDPLRLDVARTPHRDFLVMAGLGYDAHIIENATRELKKRVGFLAYLYGALKGLVRRPYIFRLSLDGRPPVRVKGIAAAVFNTGTFIGALRPLRGVSPRDGLLDVVVVSPENFTAFFRMLFLGLIGRLHDDPRVKTWQAARVRLECRPAAPLEVDGDLIDRHREVQVECLPKALTVMVPSEGMSKVPWLPDWKQGGGFLWGRGAKKERQLEKSRSGDQPPYEEAP